MLGTSAVGQASGRGITSILIQLPLQDMMLELQVIRANDISGQQVRRRAQMNRIYLDMPPRPL